MQDQAAELRSLVLRSVRERAARCGPSPRLLVVSGGRAGVGVTTLAVNLGLCLAEQGVRIVLVDCAPYGTRAATWYGLDGPHTIADVLSARRDIHEVLQLGPWGVQLVAGSAGCAAVWSEVSQQRLINQLHELGQYADLVLLDIGSGSGETARRFWQAASEVVLVTTPETGCIMDTYATIKATTAEGPRPSVQIVVNAADSAAEAEDVFERLSQSCLRFLNLELTSLGWIPREMPPGEPGRSGKPTVIATPETPSARTLHAMATTLGRLTGAARSSSEAVA